MTTATQSQLLKVETQLTTDQIQRFFVSTPPEKVKTRPAKGGGQWKYVSGSYVTQVLNSLFGFNWSFTVDTGVDEALQSAKSGCVVVKGTLKVKIGDEWITKEQFGKKEVTFKKDTTIPLDFGNDMKAAATDAKKKCASELGLFADVYSQEDFLEVRVIDDQKKDERDSEAVVLAVQMLEASETLDELKTNFSTLGALISNKTIVAAKDKRKAELSESTQV